MNISHLAQTASIEDLEAWGPVSHPLSMPACEVRGLLQIIPGKESVDTGIWECSPGRFRRAVSDAEVMHFVKGRCTFIPDGGAPPIRIAAGDTLFMPPNTYGVWEIDETVRKTYVLL